MSLANLDLPPQSLNATRPAGFVAQNSMKILLVDDEPLNIALLEDVLSANGYARVSSVTDSRLAQETCATFQPDLVLLDLMMPYLDGFGVLEQLRSEQDEIFLPVIVLTADANEATKLRALREGASDFLLKPFDETEILLRIANMLEIRRLNLQLDMQRAAYEEAVRGRTEELQEAHRELEKMRSELEQARLVTTR